MPLPCYDASFIEDYQDDGSWAAFADEEMTVLLTVEEMGEREFYWTSVRDHVVHCALLWKKQFVYLFEERPAVDDVLVDGGHTE